MKKEIFIHLGLPKCASTTIQTVLSQSEDIEYIGFIPDGFEGKYFKDDNMSELFDNNLRFCLDNPSFYKKLICDHIEKSTKNTIVFSSENLTLRWLSWDLPTYTKLEYLKKIFPKDSKFIYVYRNPEDLLLSLYKEELLIGYDKEFNEYVNELYLFRKISYFNDLLLGRFLNNFYDVFPNNSLNIVYLEEENIIEQIGKILKTDFKKCKVKSNISISDDVIDYLIQYNKTTYDFKSNFDQIEMHRSFPSLENDNIKYGLSKKRNYRKSIIKDYISYNLPIKGSCLEIQDRNILNFILDDLSEAYAFLENYKMKNQYLLNYRSFLKKDENG
ncbi:MAG: sulfotransferase domain-containing protein [Campylobacterota bacterium]|nr:sulfotransferase domain-containing protein [Campylobacterota bacterium]